MDIRPNTLLSVENLSIRFGKLLAVDGVSFAIEEGKCLGIVGESGSGKSICSLAIMRLLPTTAEIDQGQIQMVNSRGAAEELLLLSEKKMQAIRGRDVSMIFQEPMTSLNPVKRCGNQVAEVLVKHKRMNRKQARAEVLRLFEEVRLPKPDSAYNSFPHQLSGGQRQRVMIAQALACQPRLLIADEPTTALDVTVQKAIIELLKDLQDKYKMGMIFITHDLGLVSKVADEIAVMHKGKIVEQGKASDILSNPKQDYTQGLLKCRPTLETKSDRLPTVAEFMGNGKDRDARDHAIPGQHDYNSEPILKLDKLSVSFPMERNFLGNPIAWLKAVDEVSLQVWAGETLGLVGESGCGKTTLGRAILRLQTADAGKIQFDGKSVLTLSPKEMKLIRKRMQIIFQDPYSSLNPRMQIGSAITEPMMVHGLYGSASNRKKRAKELMEQVGLDPDSFHRYPHEFSGGQRQRICIARALAVEPDFIVCDESVSALDVSVQAQVLNLLKDLKDEFKLTYIFISHDLSVVKYMSDRIAVMRKGKIVELQEAEELYRNPKEDYTRTLIDAIPLV